MPPSGKRLALALRRNPLDMRRHLRDRRPAQLVVGAEHVEHRRRIGQQMLAAFSREADRVRHDHHRIDFGAIGDRVEAPLSRQRLRELFRGLGEARPQRPHHRRRQRAIEHGAGAIVLGRVALENQARRPPRLLALKVAQAHAAAGTEGRRIIEDLPDLGMPRRGVGAIFFEPHDRPGLAQGLVRGKRIAQHIERKRIDRRSRNPGGRTAARRHPAAWRRFLGGIPLQETL